LATLLQQHIKELLSFLFTTKRSFLCHRNNIKFKVKRKREERGSERKMRAVFLMVRIN